MAHAAVILFKHTLTIPATLCIPPRSNSCPSVQPTLSSHTHFSDSLSCQSELFAALVPHTGSDITDPSHINSGPVKHGSSTTRAKSDFQPLTITPATSSEYCNQRLPRRQKLNEQHDQNNHHAAQNWLSYTRMGSLQHTSASPEDPAPRISGQSSELQNAQKN